MNNIFQEALDHFHAVYLDEILLYLSSTSEHIHHMEWILSKLRSNYLSQAYQI